MKEDNEIIKIKIKKLKGSYWFEHCKPPPKTTKQERDKYRTCATSRRSSLWIGNSCRVVGLGYSFAVVMAGWWRVVGIVVVGWESRVWKWGWRLMCVSGEDSSVRMMEARIEREREIEGRVSKNTGGLWLRGGIGWQIGLEKCIYGFFVYVLWFFLVTPPCVCVCMCTTIYR